MLIMRIKVSRVESRESDDESRKSRLRFESARISPHSYRYNRTVPGMYCRPTNTRTRHIVTGNSRQKISDINIYV
jgi:hypothetical protein